jgi:hypothetical protein
MRQCNYPIWARNEFLQSCRAMKGYTTQTCILVTLTSQSAQQSNQPPSKAHNTYHSSDDMPSPSFLLDSSPRANLTVEATTKVDLSNFIQSQHNTNLNSPLISLSPRCVSQINATEARGQNKPTQITPLWCNAQPKTTFVHELVATPSRTKHKQPKIDTPESPQTGTQWGRFKWKLAAKNNQ